MNNLSLSILALLVLYTSALVQGQVTDPFLGEPYQLSANEGEATEAALITDSTGAVHAVWVEFGFSDRKDLVRYARYSSDVWSDPITLFTTNAGTSIRQFSLFLDPTDKLHLAWAAGNNGPVFLMCVSAGDSLVIDKWSEPIVASIPAFWLRLLVDGAGTLHIVYSRFFNSEPGVYYVHSSDSGLSWSDPVQLDPDRPVDFTPFVLQAGIDEEDGLHAVWHYIDRSAPGNPGRWIRYVRSLDGGSNWSDPMTIDRVDQDSNDLRLPYPGLAVRGRAVHVVWAGDERTRRSHRYSLDRGDTWSETAAIFGELHAQALGDGLSIDPDGRLHFIGQLRWVRGIYRAVWEDGSWSSPSMIYLISSQDSDPIGERIHAHRTRGALIGDRLVVTFTTAPADPRTILYAVSQPLSVLYFPHYGDGLGLSTLFAINNNGSDAATGRMTIFDSDGIQQILPFEDVDFSQTELNLGPQETRVYATRGDSPLLKTGLVKMEFDKPNVSGVAIFKLESGAEASVLPSRPGKKFFLFVEVSDLLDTGLAIYRPSPATISLRLFNLEGLLVDAVDYDFSGVQEARFLSTLFDFEDNFQGLLIIESEAYIVPIGLRFGDGILSTIPVSTIEDEVPLTP